MEYLLLVIVLVIVIIIQSSLKSHFSSLDNSIKKMSQRLDDLQKQIQQGGTIKPGSIEKEPKAIEKIIEEPPIRPAVQSPIEQRVRTEHVAVSEKAKTPDVVRSIEPQKTTQVNRPAPQTHQPSWYDRFKERNPDLEKFIGENLINKIGILILVLGISFFVKYAIDKEWINEIARVGIGILSGLVLLAVSHKLRKKFAAFSSVLVAGAISVFYFTIAIAFHDYHIFNQTAAFIIMTVITIFSAVIALSYNRVELAILSLIGGFGVPFMISTGEGNHVVLFTYILILDCGILAISYFKKWNILTLLAFIFTTLLYSSWMSLMILENQNHYESAFLFATLFYFVFSNAVFLGNARNQWVYSKLDYFLLLSNTFVFFSLGITLMDFWGVLLKGLFTISLAMYNLIFALILYRKYKLERTAVFLLFGITLTFITLTIPIQFEGNHITLFWAAEAVVLIWLATQSKIHTFRLGAVLVQILALISLFMDWANIYVSSAGVSYTGTLNTVFISGAAIVISLSLCYLIARKETQFTVLPNVNINLSDYKNSLLIAAILVGYLSGIQEIYYHSHNLIPSLTSAFSYPTLYHYLFLVVLVFFFVKSGSDVKSKIAIVISGVNILIYSLFFARLPINEMVYSAENEITLNNLFYTHYPILLCLIFFITIIIKETKRLNFVNSDSVKVFTWIFTAAGVYVISQELILHGLYFQDIVAGYEITESVQFVFYKAQLQLIKIGLPILWGLISFVLLVIGIKKELKQLRIISLTLLGITILKLFIFDISNVSETGKIISFILLGVLILIISFIYQKIKKMVIDPAGNNETTREDSDKNEAN